jgi:dienelactone hydrolase
LALNGGGAEPMRPYLTTWFMLAVVFMGPAWAESKAKEKKVQKVLPEAEKRYAEYLSRKMAVLPPKRISDTFPRTREEWLEFSAGLRKELRRLFYFPESPCPLNPRITGKVDLPDLVIEKLIYDSEPGSSVLANVYVPKGVKFPVPALICPSGHGGSKISPYNQYVGQIYAKGGVIVLIPEPIGECERNVGGRHDTHAPRSWKVGKSTIGKMVYDVVRGIDYLCTRPDVDKTRIGCTGHSLGGTLTEYVTALDERVKVSMPTAWTCNFKLIVPDPSLCWRPYDLLKFANDPELFALAAPHCATLVLAGEKDACPTHVDNFKRTTYVEARRVFALFGREDCFQVHVTPKAGHQPFQTNKPAYAWVAKHLGLPKMTMEQVEKLPEVPDVASVCGDLAPSNDKKSEALRKDVERMREARAVVMGVHLLPEATLNVVSPDDRKDPRYSIEGWLKKIEAGLPPEFAVPTTRHAWEKQRKALREKIRSALALPASADSPAPLHVETISCETAEEFRLEKVVYGELGLTSYVLVANTTPDVGPGGRSCLPSQRSDHIPRRPAVIYLHKARDKEMGLKEPEVEQLLKDGNIVLLLDSLRSEYPGTINDSDMLIGGSCVMRNVQHVLESLDYLCSRGDVDSRNISCICAVDDTGAFAAALDERISRVEARSRGEKRGEPPNVSIYAGRAALLALIAPRKLILKSKEERADTEKLKTIYRLFGQENALTLGIQ